MWQQRYSSVCALHVRVCVCVRAHVHQPFSEVLLERNMAVSMEGEVVQAL